MNIRDQLDQQDQGEDQQQHKQKKHRKHIEEHQEQQQETLEQKSNNRTKKLISFQKNIFSKIYIVMSRVFEAPREGLNYDVYGGSVPNGMLYRIKQIEGLSKQTLSIVPNSEPGLI
jgi:hypothetical protein